MTGEPGDTSRSQRGMFELCSEYLALSKRSPHAALQAISSLVLRIISYQSSVARVFSSPELDSLCESIGSALTNDIRPGNSPGDRIVYLLTQLGRSGGHSRVLLDLIAAEPGPEKILILSHVPPATESFIDQAALAGVTIHVTPDCDLAAKVSWIAHKLAELCPRKTYMMLHHFDSVLVAAARPWLTGRLVYIHNCDHSLALGVHIEHGSHVDHHRKGYLQCKRERSGEPPHIVPLAAADLGHRVGLPFFLRGHLLTCTSGGFEKFTNQHFIERIPYHYTYPEMVEALLGVSRGTHIHIGPLPQSCIDEIAGAVEELGLEASRFVHVPHVDSVWQFLLDQTVDLYVGSVPLGGGRATVEAMGAGLPLLIHSNYRSEFLSVEFEVYENAMIWRNFAQLRQHVRTLNVENLQRHSALARGFYKAHHTMQKFQEALARVDSGLPEKSVPGYIYLPDRLQEFLDEHPRGAA